MKRCLASFFLIVLIISLSACSGWRLRGTDNTTLQANSIFLEGESSSTFSLIQERLNKKNSLTSLDTADFILRVSNEKFDRRTASVNSRAVTAQYELTLTVDYQILDGQQNILRPTTKVRVIRSYNFDQNDVVGKDKEELILKKDMEYSAARRILQQLQLLQRNR